MLCLSHLDCTMSITITVQEFTITWILHHLQYGFILIFGLIVLIGPPIFIVGIGAAKYTNDTIQSKIQNNTVAINLILLTTKYMYTVKNQLAVPFPVLFRVYHQQCCSAKISQFKIKPLKTRFMQGQLCRTQNVIIQWRELSSLEDILQHTCMQAYTGNCSVHDCTTFSGCTCMNIKQPTLKYNHSSLSKLRKTTCQQITDSLLITLLFHQYSEKIFVVTFQNDNLPLGCIIPGCISCLIG